MDASKLQNSEILSSLENYKTIIKNPLGKYLCDFLLYILDNRDINIVNDSLDIILLISLDNTYVKDLQNIPKLKDSLNCARKMHNHTALHKKVENILANVCKIEAENNVQNFGLNHKNYLQQEINASHSVEYTIKGLTKESLPLCKNVLINTKGVISFTFNILSESSNIRTRKNMDPFVLIKALNEIPQIESYLVVKNKLGQKVILKDDKEYLADNITDKESPCHKGSSSICRPQDLNKNINKASSWFKSAMNYVNDSLYW